MVFSLLAYFVSMLAALGVVATLWIGEIDRTSERVDLKSYPMSRAAEVARAAPTPAAPSPEPTAAIAAAPRKSITKARHLAAARRHAGVVAARERAEAKNRMAFGYAGDPRATFPPAFSPWSGIGTEN